MPADRRLRRPPHNSDSGGYVEDPTTLGLNLTFFGTLGLALLMFLSLGILVAITLVLVGVAKLVSIILLAMVGIFPKRDVGPVVHLPPRPRRAPALKAVFEESTTAEPGTPEPALLVPGEPRPGILTTVKLVWSTAWSAIRNFSWKSLVNPRKWPKPAQVKAGIAATATAVATTQAKEHPFVVTVKQDPPVMNSEWAAAVAEADARAAARAEEAATQTGSATQPEAAPPPETAPPIRGRVGDPHGGKAASSGRVTASAGARPPN
ncbi:hypothetical protein GCM10023063_47140 [Arthrobacter methylotrophus]